MRYPSAIYNRAGAKNKSPGVLAESSQPRRLPRIPLHPMLYRYKIGAFLPFPFPTTKNHLLVNLIGASPARPLLINLRLRYEFVNAI